MWQRIVEAWKRFIRALTGAFVLESPYVPEPAPEVEEEDSVAITDPVDQPVTEDVDEDDTAAEIIKAIWAEELKDLTLEELDQLAADFFKEDPEVEIVDTPTGDFEAGPTHHGQNTEEEMLGTYDPNEVYVDEPWVEDDNA